MPSYVVTGASRGLGYEFIRQLSADKNAVVIGLVRNKAATEKRVAAEIGRSNIHILHGDLDDYESLKKAAEDTSKITGGGLDYLIANAAIVSVASGYKTLHTQGEDPKDLEEDLLSSYKTNVVGNVHLFNLFLPLIRRGEVKKVISITSGLGEFELTKNLEITNGGPYSMSKIALNLAVAKYHGEFNGEGILFLSISPGVVETSGHNDASKYSEKEVKVMQDMFRKFSQYQPRFKAPLTPEQSVKYVMDVVNRASIETGYGGAAVSHYGNQQWL
ncbi:NAD(P)-binding protein [Hypoxylon sp. NC1633]|nr:NAD(P)-binding protein [Hypoxylon sp. NC1633]